ncbi:Pantothenate kinase [hydrothermal vent metagenome]|uniref:Pantothenate kinase n=1 Tax=hydrothermal vent metagenome TaxID=652676 RepID=A0A3B0S9N0_9ZZZZ
MLDNITPQSPYRTFSRREWAKLRDDTPLTLTAQELDELRGLNDRVDLDEVVAVYLPLSRLLNLYVAATQKLFDATKKFSHINDHKVPYIIGMAGSVAVGKSTMGRILKTLLARWPNHPKVDLLPTDGFLLPNAQLEREGLMERKGFPESYNTPQLLDFLSDIKAGKHSVSAPVYSHLAYDIIEGKTITIDQPDILIVEGLNVLQTGRPPRDGKAIPYVSDFFDFSIYIDADEEVLRTWYVDRFFSLREGAFQNPQSYFHRYAGLSDVDTRQTANRIWDNINLLNLRENIQPTRQRADLIVRKEADHQVSSVSLRRL